MNLRCVGFAMAATLCSITSAFASTQVDDAGRALSFEHPPQRVMTLAPNLTEFVYAVGAGAALVGTVDTSDYPLAARQVARVGDYQRLDVERILLLKPDVVLVWHHGNQGRELGQLEAAGIKLFYLEPRRLGDIARTLERVGSLLGHRVQGDAEAARVRGEIDLLRRSHSGAAPVSVFFQVWSRPLMTLNGEHLTSDLLSVCGGRNVFAGLSALAPQVGVESVVAANPEAIFVTDDEGSASSWQRDPDRPSLATWRGFPHMAAVAHRWLFAVPGDLVTRQGPRAIEGARVLCGALDQVRTERGPTGSR